MIRIHFDLLRAQAPTVENGAEFGRRGRGHSLALAVCPQREERTNGRRRRRTRLNRHLPLIPLYLRSSFQQRLFLFLCYTLRFPLLLLHLHLQPLPFIAGRPHWQDDRPRVQ